MTYIRLSSLLDDGRERRDIIGRPMTAGFWASLSDVVGAVVHEDGVRVRVYCGGVGVGGIGGIRETADDTGQFSVSIFCDKILAEDIPVCGSREGSILALSSKPSSAASRS